MATGAAVGRQLWLDHRKISESQTHGLVSHNCPVDVAPLVNSHHSRDRTRTNNSLQLMWEAHQLELCIFGHHHVSFDQVINGTRFVCLAELEERDFDLPLHPPAPAPDAAR